MEIKPTLERVDAITAEDETLQIISIRRLDRLETTHTSYESGA